MFDGAGRRVLLSAQLLVVVFAKKTARNTAGSPSPLDFSLPGVTYGAR